ncbi:MAG: hypothetical protein DHS20C11_22860 [Lysobacteraceae bacterium]|nr:MAG: hypothetical protein DHS20C11_22860 [Xanthomonadaceae bacterium]
MSIEVDIPGYEIHAQIGSGGMARVYRATQCSLGREVAIKVMRRFIDGDSSFQGRFMHEGKLLAELNHPNIVSIYDIGRSGDDYYMAMEYLQGGILTERQRQGLSLGQVINICVQISHALEVAHQHRIVHRDLKPSNIMFRDSTTPVLTDFGIARKTNLQQRMTKTGMVIGTPFYMSPEQTAGQPIDGRADLYSLGIMFYELLTGDVPFRSNDPITVAVKHLHEQPPPLPEDLSSLQPVINRMLAKLPENRFDNMVQFCRALQSTLVNEEQLVDRVSVPTEVFDSDRFRQIYRNGPHSKARRKRLRIVAMIAAVAMLGAGGYYYQTEVRGTLGLSAHEKRMADNLLRRIDGYLGANAVDHPAGENAVDAYHQVTKIAPRHPALRNAARHIAEYYEVDARIALDNGQAQAALEYIDAGLLIAPDFEPLTSLHDQARALVTAMQRRQQVAMLIEQALSGFDTEALPSTNTEAFDLLRQALILEPANDAATSALSRLQAQSVAAIEAMMDQGHLQQAAAQMLVVEQQFAGAASLARVRRTLDTLIQEQQDQQAIDAILIVAEQQMKDGALSHPANDNATASYQHILSLQPTNPVAAAGLNNIANRSLTNAVSSFNKDDHAAAVRHATEGLRAIPDHPQLLALQRNATSALNLRDRQLQRHLQQAEQHALNGQFFGEDSAESAYRSALALDPKSQLAAESLAQLNTRVSNHVNALQREANHAAALELIAQALHGDPENGDLLAQQSRSIASLNRQRLARERMAQLNRLSRRITDESLTVNDVASIAETLTDVLQTDPGDAQANALLDQFTATVDGAASARIASNEPALALALIDAALEYFDANAVLATSRQRVEHFQTEALAQERERIARLSGWLAIDSTPWSEVLGIAAADGTAMEVPDSPTTPLLLSLIEGRYSITLRSSEGDERVFRTDIGAGQKTLHRVDFQSIDVASYFDRAGWR